MKSKVLIAPLVLFTLAMPVCGEMTHSIRGESPANQSRLLPVTEEIELNFSSALDSKELILEKAKAQCCSPNVDAGSNVLITPFGNVQNIQESEATPCVQPTPSSCPKSTTPGSNQSSSPSSLLPPVDVTANCPPDTENDGYVISFSDIVFEEYLHFLTKLTNTNFIYNKEDVQFTVSIMADEPTNLKEVRTALLQILRVQGLTLVEEGNNLIITKDSTLRAVGTVISEELKNICDDSDPLITRVFYLKNAVPSKVGGIVSAMISPGAIVEAADDTHHLIVTDVSSNVQGISDLLKSLDNPEAAFEIGTYQSQQTYLGNLIGMAEKIMSPLIEGNPLVMVPQEKSSTIFIVSTPYLVQKSLEVLQALDMGDKSKEVAPDGHAASAEFYIYKLQYHKGDQIQETLKDIAEDLTATGNANAQLMMTINSAQWIESTNSLLFIGNNQNLQKIKDLLEIIDAPLRQVFIEVLAVRTTMNNSLELGVQYGYRAKGSDHLSMTGSLFTSPNPTAGGSALKPNLFTQGLDAVTGPGVPIPQTSNALGFSAGVIGNVLFSKQNFFFDLAGLINALQTDTSTQVLSNPKMVTQDTIPATFYVGSTRPFQTNSILQASGSSSGNFVTASIEYRQLGLSLTVTPYLGSGDTITLEIEQSTSDFVNNAVAGGNNSSNFAIVPITTDSSITTRVHIPNKHFLMISGMLEDVKTKTKSGLPCLGGLPLIGDLFGNKANSLSKDNLIIFVRPQIIDSTQELDAITSREDRLYQKKNQEASFFKNSEQLYFMNN